MAQTDRILAHLKSEGTLRPFEAWRELGIYRLASRINDLRKAGHKINTKKVEVINQWGEIIYIAEYSLEAENAA